MSSLLPLLLLALSAQADEPVVPAGHPVMAGEVQVTVLPAEPQAVLQQGESLWVLTAAGAVQTWQGGPEGWTLASEQPMPQASGLFLAQGEPWVVVHEVKALPLGQYEPGRAAPVAVVGAPSTGGSQPAAVSAGAPPELGSVLSVGQGTVVVDLGRIAGIGPGTDLRFLGTQRVEVPSLSGEGVEEREVDRVSGSGRVRLVEDERALVDIDRGGRVGVGDRVELVEKGIHYPAAPERLGGLRETGLIVRPVLGLDTLGVAFINELWTTWTFEQPWYATVRVTPLALGWSRDGNPISVAGLISGGYDARYLSVGLGAGWSMLNGDPSDWGRSYQYTEDSGGWGAVQFDDVDNAFSVVQEARLGSRDGVNLTVRNTFVLVPQQESSWNGSCEGEDYYYYYQDNWDECYDVTDTGKSFEYGGIAMALYVPVGSRTDLFSDFGTGGSGVTWVEGGVATWLRGHGDKGSLGISVAAGYGSLQAQPNDEWVELYGPLVSLGARWRW